MASAERPARARAIGYARLSRASNDDSTSIARQREHIEKLAAARNFELIDIAEDIDVSATKTRLERTGLNRVRAALKSGAADYVLVWRIDRLARSVVDMGTLLDEGVRFISQSEPDFDTSTATGKAVIQVLQVFAELEAQTTGVRTRDMHRYLREQGRWTGGPRPFGYDVVDHPSGQGKALAIRADEAAVVRRMVDAILDGRTAYRVMHDLNDEGIPTSTGGRWSPRAVTKILTGDHILGRAPASRLINGTRVRDVVRDERGIPVTRWEPIVSIDDAERVRAILTPTHTPGRAEATRRARADRRIEMLTDLLPCASCGRPMVYKVRTSTGDPVYQCLVKSRGGDCAKATVVRADLAEAEVTRQFLAIAGHLRVTRAVVTAHDAAELTVVREALRSALSRVETEPDTDLAVLLERVAKLRQEADRLASMPQEAQVQLIESEDTFADVWDRYTPQERQAALAGSPFVIELDAAARRGHWDPSRIRLIPRETAAQGATERGEGESRGPGHGTVRPPRSK
ncbi:hypothetical protein CH252_33015 [Rhodococcus sp. 06-1477-1B]|nr:hypothetical protein CH252_33015 [Rhodococcus sp. 06-1477-1B]